ARRPDIAGAALLTAAIVAIVYPLLEGRSLGWPPWIWLMLAGGAVGIGALAFVEERRQRGRIAPVLRTRLFRIPAFAAGLGVQLAFAAGLQGFFLIFTIWVQAGQHFSPLRAGLTAVAFSAGSFILAPVAVPVAQRYGRLVLVAGAVLMAAGVVAVDVGAHHIGTGTSPWPLVPGLVVAGAGLALLVLPLGNVVLAARPPDAAGGASGLFSTAQQVGGAVGIAAVGTVFFDYLGAHSFVAAFTHTAPLTAVWFLACAVLSCLLPRTAVAGEPG